MTTRIGMAAARRNFRDVLDRVRAGEVVEIARRGEVVAVVSPPGGGAGRSAAGALQDWRGEWDVASWPDDDPFALVRDPTPGREPVW